MTTLVQLNLSPHYPQMTSGERQLRPSNSPSKNLFSHELQCLYDILGQNRVTLATAVAQILHGNQGTWRKQACGVFCFVKDYENKNYYFRLYDLRAGQSIYEEIAPGSLRLEKASDVFYTFDGSNCKIGINFVDRDEAQTFSHHFHSKQENRQNKREGKKRDHGQTRQPPQLPSQISTSHNPSVMSTMMNGIKPPPISATHTLTPQTITTNTPKKSESKKEGFFTIGRKKNKNLRPDISAPIQSTLVHVNHIGTHESFFKDDKQRQIFEDVLAGLKISPEEQSYVRNYIQTGDGFNKIFKTPQTQLPFQPPPDLPPRGNQTLGRNTGGRGPNQDISIPLSTQNRSQPLQDLFTAPMIPPRPGPRIPDNTHSSAQAPQAPPPPPPPVQPPIPVYQPDSSRIHAPSGLPPPPPPPPGNFGGAPPPPPPPPLPDNFNSIPSPPLAPPMQLTTNSRAANSSSSSSSMLPVSPARDDLLSQIRDFNTMKLKAKSERPALPQVQSSAEQSPGAQDTMAVNILKILQERREKIIGQDDHDESGGSDDSEDEWST